MEERKIIPICHDGSDLFYWKDLFKNKYKETRDVIYQEFHFQGDIEQRDDGTPRCRCGRGKFKPKFHGSLDVGYELVYYCVDCGNLMRVWSKVCDDS